MEYYKTIVDNINKNSNSFWIGVVEDNADPMKLGRVKVRIFGLHTEDRSLIKTKDLPWAIALQPANSASTSGIGWSPNGLEPSSWVFGLFLDGELGQYPMVLGSIPGVHRGGAPGEASATGSGYLDSKPAGHYSNSEPYHGQGVENSGAFPGTGLPNTTSGGNAIRDNGERLTLGNTSQWPLTLYTYKPSNGNNGLACKDGSLDMHKSTCQALEELTKQWGKGALKINSAYRSPSYNARIGGANNSMHMHGRAFDIQLSSIGGQTEISNFVQLAVKNGFTGFGLYSSFLHIDTGSARTWLGANASWFQSALKQAGWYPGKSGLQGVKSDNNNPSSNTSGNSTDSTVINNNTSAITGKATAYGPGYDPRMEGGTESSIAGPDGQSVVRTLEDYRTGRSSYITLAGNKKFYGNEYTIPSITYDYGGNRYTLNNVRGVVHDTGGAFKNAEEGRFDIPVANNIGGSQLSSQPFSGQNLTFIPGGNGNYKQSSMPGFNDPTNSLPFAHYRGTPSTHENARGFNGIPHLDYTKRNTGSHSGYPAAGSKGSFGEPASPFAPQYPFNKTYGTKSGHIIELDDTPNAERINICHKSGTKWEISSKGTSVFKVMGNSYHFTTGNSYVGASGDLNITSVGALGIRSTSDLTIHSDGSKCELVYGNDSTTISGNLDILVGGVCQVKASKILIEANDIDIYSKGNLSIETEGKFSLKAAEVLMESKGNFNAKASGGNAVISGSGDVQLKGSTVYMDDVVRMAEGGAKEAPSAKTAASTDLGKAPDVKQINKNPAPSVNFDIYTTSDDAAGHYST